MTSFHQIKKNVLEGKYLTNEKMVADLMQLMENLKQFLGVSSNYYRASI